MQPEAQGLVTGNERANEGFTVVEVGVEDV
jgi:hypothetical protein